MEEGEEQPLSSTDTAERRDQTCWSRLCHAPWARLAFGEDPALLAILIIFAVMLMPFFDGLGSIFMLALIAVFLIRAWLWCHSGSPERDAEPHGEDAESSSEQKSGDIS